MKRGIIFLIIFLLGVSVVSATDWQQQETDTDLDLYEVHMVDQRLGYAVGGEAFDSGVVLITEDGGETWEEQFTTTDALYGVCFDDRNNGWIVGGSSLVYYTRDGGEEWLPFEVPYSMGFWDVHCVGDEAYAVGDGEKSIIKFVGEGHIPLAEGYVLQGVYMVDEDNGYAVGDGGVILMTNDGSSFERVANISRSDVSVGLKDVYCLDMDSCWATGVGNYVYSGARESWSQEEAGTLLSGFWGIHYASEDEAWLAGQNCIRYYDGEDWTQQRAVVGGATSSSIPVNMMRDVQFVEDVGWAVGDDGMILNYREEPLVCPDVENDCEMFWDEVFDEVTGCLTEYECIDVEVCPEVEEEDCEVGYTPIELTDSNGCITGYLCQENTVFVAVEPLTCQEEYRECLEEYPFNHAYCDGTYEFCDGIDEVLEDFLGSDDHNDAIYEFLRVDEITDYLPDEEANLFIMQEDGSQWVITLAVSKAGGVVIGSEELEGANYNVYLDQSFVDDLSKSTDVKGDVRAGLKDKSVVVKASGLKSKVKLGFVKVLLLFS
ncbi:hypothetical protein HOC80_02060 [archaeon]|jgi:photosystem II stability/assembly factor-like uncharacterized protein|nr:hypothetical protein [archaeon]MBT4416866.1 hypothetical protein [archaeon]